MCFSFSSAQSPQCAPTTTTRTSVTDLTCYARKSVCVCINLCLYIYMCVPQICRLKCRLHTAKRLLTHTNTHTHCKLTFVKYILSCFPSSALKRKAPSLEFSMQTMRTSLQCSSLKVNLERMHYL